MPYKDKQCRREWARVYMKEYRLKHPEWARECKRRYREKHREKMNEYNRRWNKLNPFKRRENHLRWCDKDPLRKKRQWQKAQAKRRKAGYLSVKIIQEVYEENIKKYGTLTCSLCLKAIEFGQDSIDHTIPLSKGGTHEKRNLSIAHIKCNQRKGNRGCYTD